jgi:hypothetical protein
MGPGGAVVNSAIAVRRIPRRHLNFVPIRTYTFDGEFRAEEAHE